jgi:hypothetical protein
VGNQSAVIPLFGRDFTSKSPTVTAQILINMYREPCPDADKAAMVFYQTPGLTLAQNLSGQAATAFGTNTNAQPCRGARTIGLTTWMVFGPFVFALGTSTVGSGSNGSSAILLTTTAGRVSLSDNGSQLIIVDGAFGYTIPLNANGDGGAVGSFDIIQIVSAGFPNGATVVEFLNGYFIVDNPNASRPGQFNWSSQYAGGTWSSLDFANAESSPDPLVTLKVKAGQLYLFGTLTYEVWSPSGDSAVFRRIGGTGQEWGCAAKFTVVDFGDNSLAMLAKNKLGQFIPAKITGYTVAPIGGEADSEIVNSMNQAGAAAAATAYSYSVDAHSFYQVNFPGKSYLFDNLSNAWTQLISNGGRHYGEIRVESVAVAGFFGSAYPLVFDYRNANMYLQSPVAYVDNADPIIRTLVSKHVFSNYDRVSINELYVDCEVGTADVPSSGNRAPQIMLEWSKDGGRTWGNQIFQSLGNIGGYQTRARWQNLGIARDWVFRFSFSENNKLVITNAAVRVS